MARREINVFNIAFLDLISGALGAVIILYVAVPKNNVNMVEDKEHQAIVKKNNDLEKQVENFKNEIKELKKEHKEKAANYEEKIKEAKKAIERIEKIQKTEEQKLSFKESEKKSKKTDQGIKAVGFDFKGKELVFLIDISGSMKTNNLIGEVKAGLKMLVTSLTKEYKVDVVFFPDGMSHSYRALWGRTKPMTKENKDDIYTYLRGFIPFGATPTRDVLNFALDQYPKASDIILLSDGAPSKPNSPSADNIEDIIKEISQKNKNKNNIQINTLGVGPDFRFGERESSDLYKFLYGLSKENGGFFHGF